MEKLQARAAAGPPPGSTPGTSPAPPSPQSQQPSARLPTAPSTSPAAQQRPEIFGADASNAGPDDWGIREPSEAPPQRAAAMAMDTAASLSDQQEQPLLPVSPVQMSDTVLLEKSIFHRAKHRF